MGFFNLKDISLQMTNYTEMLLNSVKPIPSKKGQLNGIYTNSLLKGYKSTRNHHVYIRKANNLNGRNISDQHSFPTNYPSTTYMQNSMPSIGVNMGAIPW